MECVYADDHLDLQVGQRKKREYTRAQWTEEVAVKVPLSFFSPVSCRVPRKPLAFSFQEQAGCLICSKLEATVYLRPIRLQQRLQRHCTKHWSSPADASWTAGTRRPRSLIPVQMLPANSLTSLPFYSPVVSLRSFLWRHQVLVSVFNSGRRTCFLKPHLCILYSRDQ